MDADRCLDDLHKNLRVLDQNCKMLKEDVMFSNYSLCLDMEGEVTICIKAETEIQIQNQYSTVFVFKENNLRIFPVSNNFLQIWGISGDKSIEMELRIPDFPFYKSTSKPSIGTTGSPKLNKLLFSASKISLLKEFISSLFKEKSLDYCWISGIDGNSISIDFNDDQVQVLADDPVMLSRFLKKILDWAEIPIVVSCLQLDKECFRRSLRFWVQELTMKSTINTLTYRGSWTNASRIIGNQK